MWSSSSLALVDVHKVVEQDHQSLHQIPDISCVHILPSCDHGYWIYPLNGPTSLVLIRYPNPTPPRPTNHIHLGNTKMAPIPFYGHNPVKLGYKVIKIVNVKTFLNIQGPLYILRSYCLLPYCGYMVDKNSNQLWFPTFFLNINNVIEKLVTFKVLCHPLITYLTNI